MKLFLLILFSSCYFNCFAQKDKTLTWVLPQEGNEKIIISNASPKRGSHFYEQVFIKPNSIKNLHVVVGSINVDDELYKSETFAIQIFSRKKTWVSLTIKEEYNYKANIPLKDTDSVAVRISINANAVNKNRFFVEYILADTAALDYSNLTPQACFEKMLEMATSGFINLPPHKQMEFPEIVYEKGLFAPFYAIRGGTYAYSVRQPTSKIISTYEEANSNFAFWNTQILHWLKDYNVTDINKKITYKIDETKVEQETVYTKKNAAGKPLFKVTIYKALIRTSTPYRYQTGIKIENE